MRTVRQTVLVFALAAALTLMAWPGSQALAQKKTTFCASWIINAERAMHIISVEKGYFKAEGLDVNYIRGFGSGDTFKRLGAGACDIAETAAGAVVLGRVKGIPAKLVAMQSHKLEETLYYFVGSGIKSPKDLEGKRVTGGPKAASNTLMFPLFARANGIDSSKVQLLYMSPAVKISSFAAGKVDAVVSYHRSLPSYEKAAGQVGKKLKIMLFADHGIDIYSQGITASDKAIATRGDFVHRFLRAIFRGMADSLRDPEGTVDLYLKKIPGASRKLSLQTFRLVQDFWFDSHYKKGGVGHINRKKMAETIRLTLGSRGMKTSLTPDDFMTNQFIDRLPRELRFPRG